MTTSSGFNIVVFGPFFFSLCCRFERYNEYIELGFGLFNRVINSIIGKYTNIVSIFHLQRGTGVNMLVLSHLGIYLFHLYM